MAGEDLIEKVRGGYEAFSRGDAQTAIDLFHDDVTWTTPGTSAVSGTFRGKEEVMQMWGRLGEGFSVQPRFFTADDTHVVAIALNRAGGEEWESADVFTFEGDKIKSFRELADPGPVERAYPAA